MAKIHVSNRTLSVQLTRLEKVFGLLRDVQVPRAAIISATVEDDGLRAARGLRAPGLAIPGVRKIGTWRRLGHRAAVSVRRNEAALNLRLQGHRFDQLLIGATDARDIARRLEDKD